MFRPVVVRALVLVTFAAAAGCSAEQLGQTIMKMDQKNKAAAAESLCARGTADACHRAGQALEEEQRLAKAKEYYQRGCRMGHGSSCQSATSVEQRCASAPVDSAEPCYQ